MNNKISFSDIMSNRKNSSDFCWILKDYESKVSYFNNYKSSEFVKRNLLDSPSFKYDLKLLADKIGKNDELLMKEALIILNGMNHNIGMNSIRLMGYTLSKIIKQIYQKVYVNAEQIEKLRNAFTRSNVVLLPTHRSYADFLLMSYVMFQFDLPMPVIAAAMDFMNMKLVGELLRCCGAFFIRRSFATDELYWCVFSHYIKALVELGQEPLEFFIEGTRSRTNKSLFPRTGLLGIVLSLWLSKGIDVELVPISISYDRVLEERLYAWELLGVPKPRESTSGLLKVRHILNDDYGNIFFNVGDPISIGELAGGFGVRRSDHNLELRWKPSLFDREKELLRHLANLVVASQQRSVVICDWAICAFVLMREAPLVTQTRLAGLFAEMCSVLTSFCALVAPEVTSEDGECVAEQRVARALQMHKATERFCSAEQQQQQPMGLEARIVDWIELGNGRNPLLFHLARESLLLTRLSNGGTLENVAADFTRVLDLMCREFIYCSASDFGSESALTTDFNATIDRLVAVNLLHKLPSTIDRSVQPNLDHPCYALVRSAVHTHLVAYAICGHMTVCQESLATSALEQCKSIQKYMKEICSRESLFSNSWMEMCSLDIIKNAVTRYNELMKSCPLHEIRLLIDKIGFCLPQEIKQKLLESCVGIFISS